MVCQEVQSPVTKHLSRLLPSYRGTAREPQPRIKVSGLYPGAMLENQTSPQDRLQQEGLCLPLLFCALTMEIFTFLKTSSV